jgi:magnesium transporter
MSEGATRPTIEPREDDPRDVADSGADGGSPADQAVAEIMEEATIDVEALAEAVERQEAPDAADTLEDLDEEEAAEVLEEMDAKVAADALAEMRPVLAAGVIEDLILEGKLEYAGHLLELMAPDDAVDLLQAVPQATRESLLGVMKQEASRALGQLVTYHRESAGGMMTTDFLALRERMTVNQAIEYIRGSQIGEDIVHALVRDDNDRLVGIITLRQLLLAKSSERIADLMERDVESVPADMDRESVAHHFDRYNHSVLPVADRRGKVLGIITVDDVIDIIREEQTEDVQRSVGAGALEAVYSPVRDKFKGRIRWLSASLGLMCGSAAVILAGEEMIQDNAVLIYLLPIIAAVVGNGGQQSMMVTLRGIVLNEIRSERVWPLLSREVAVGAMNGAVLGGIVFAVVSLLSLFKESATAQVGAIAGLSMCVAMAVATLAGTSIPLVMRRLGWDPAVASSIILIMITDAVSFSTLLGLTFVFLHWMGG